MSESPPGGPVDAFRTSIARSIGRPSYLCCSVLQQLQPSGPVLGAAARQRRPSLGRRQAPWLHERLGLRLDPTVQFIDEKVDAVTKLDLDLPR